MIPTINEIEEIINNTKFANVDVKETILKTVQSDWMDENYFVSDSYGEYICDLMEFDDLKYDFLSDSYFEFINEKLDEDGIYIALGYACPQYNIENQSEKRTCVSTCIDNIQLSLPKDSIIGDDTADYGIQIIKKDENYEVIFSFNDNITYGHAMGYRKISSIEDKLDEPLHRVLIKAMNDVIIFKE